MSDAGPWNDPEFTRKPKWLKKAEEAKGAAAPAPTATEAPAAVPAAAPAAAAAPTDAPVEIPVKEYTDHGINPVPAPQ